MNRDYQVFIYRNILVNYYICPSHTGNVQLSVKILYCSTIADFIIFLASLIVHRFHTPSIVL